MSKTTTQAKRKVGHSALQISRLPAKLDHDLRFKRHDESVQVCDRNLNKKTLIQVFLISAMLGLILLLTCGQTHCSKFCSTLFTLNL